MKYLGMLTAVAVLFAAGLGIVQLYRAGAPLTEVLYTGLYVALPILAFLLALMYLNLLLVRLGNRRDRKDDPTDR